MNVCIPTNDDHGLDSRICGHFGSAPLFMLVDTNDGSTRAIPNPGHGPGHGHGHGGCSPLAALVGQPIDCVVAGGIGRGAIAALQRAHVRVFLAESGTVGEAVAALADGRLAEATPDTGCGQHARHRHRHGGCG